jgi:CheY-like chemotaxis protein
MACIVIAEDQAHIRHVLTMWIKRFGHVVIEAATGRRALDALRAHPAELLITDVNMPELDGIALTRQAFDACRTLRRVFVVTSRCDQASMLAELSDPRVQVFPKPFSPSQLLQEVERAVAAQAHAGAQP